MRMKENVQWVLVGAIFSAAIIFLISRFRKSSKGEAGCDNCKVKH